MAKASTAAPRSASARRPSARPVPTAVSDPEPEVEEQTEEEPAGYSEGDGEVTDEELEQLREEALQHEVEYDEDTTVEELRERVEAAKEAEVKAHEKQKAEAARMRSIVPGAEETPSTGASPRPKGASGRTGGPKSKPAKPATLDELRNRIRFPDQQKLAANKLPDPTLADYQLADKYSYPVAIPGAKPYQIAISIACPFGGGERPAGSIMLLHPIFTANKMEYLTPV